MIYMIFICIKPLSEPLYPVTGAGVIQEETTPIKTELFHHRI